MSTLSTIQLPSSDSGRFSNAVERESRRLVNLSGYGALENGATFPLTVLDLTYDGCKIETSIALIPGLSLNLSIVRLGVINARVRWNSGGRAGLQFRSPSSSEGGQKPRANPRQTVKAEMLLRRAGPKSFRVVVNDLTCKGCKIEFVERPRIGEIIWAKFDGLEALQAKVRWVEGAWTGLEFERPLYPPVFELLLTRLGAMPA